MKIVQLAAKVGVALLVGAALSGCVVRPLWWGDRDGRGRGGHQQFDQDHGRSPGNDGSRDDGRRRGP